MVSKGVALCWRRQDYKPAFAPNKPLSSPWRHLVRNRGDLDEDDSAYSIPVGRKVEGDGDGENSGGETSAKRARRVEVNQSKVRTAVITGALYSSMSKW